MTPGSVYRSTVRGTPSRNISAKKREPSSSYLTREVYSTVSPYLPPDSSNMINRAKSPSILSSPNLNGRPKRKSRNRRPRGSRKQSKSHEK